MQDIALNVLTLLVVTLQQAGGQALAEPVTNAFDEFAANVGAAGPKIIAALILLGIGLLVGRIFGWVVKKIADRVNAEQYWNKTSFGQQVSKSGWTFDKIVSTGARWFVYIFFISAAVNVLEFTQLSEAINAVWLWLPNVIAFIIILVTGALIADFIGKWLQKELPARGVSGGKTIGLAVMGVIYAIVLAVAVTQLQIGEAVINTVISALVWGLAAAMAVGVGVGLAYGFKEAFPALIKGNTVIQPTLKPGQRVLLDGKSGVVQMAGSFRIIIKDDQGRTVVIPTGRIADRDIIIESGPAPDLGEKVTEDASVGSGQDSVERGQDHRDTTAA